MLHTRILLVLACFASALYAADKLPEKWQKRITDADAAFATATAKADKIRLTAIQKAGTERTKLLRTALAEATKAGDFETATVMKQLLIKAEIDGAVRPKPKNTLKLRGHEYAIVEDTLTWHQALRRCEEMGGHLVTFENQAEQDFILAACRERKLGVWLGLTNEGNLKEWVWITGVPAVIDQSWHLDDGGREYFSGAMTFWPDTDSFNDHNLGGHIGYICEWDE